MDALLTHYSLESEPFLQLLARPNVLLTGSSALSLYLQENGVEPGFEPNDIDIYVAMPHAVQNGTFMSFLQNADLGVLFRYLLTRGYNSIANGSEEIKEYDELPERAITLTLAREDRRIQLVALRCENLVEYLCANSDLSACMTWWNAAQGRCENAYPEWTLRRAMRRMNYGPQIHPVHQARIEKYEARGFVLESEPSAIQCLDPRLEVGALEGCQAYDVIGLEHVDAADWLRASPWNILVRVLDAFQAFDRRALYRCMADKSTTIPHYTTVYDTPHHQSLCEEALDYLLYGDWSVYELHHAHTITYGYANDRQKSVYQLICSTVHQYVMGESGVALQPMPYRSPQSIRPMDDLPPLLLLREQYASSEEEDPVNAPQRRDRESEH